MAARSDMTIAVDKDVKHQIKQTKSFEGPLIKSSSFSSIRLCGNVVYKVEKSYVDKLVTRYLLHFSLLSTSPEFFIDQNQFYFIHRLLVSYDMRFESSKTGS